MSFVIGQFPAISLWLKAKACGRTTNRNLEICVRFITQNNPQHVCDTCDRLHESRPINGSDIMSMA